jgi:hypothetical protein
VRRVAAVVAGYIRTKIGPRELVTGCGLLMLFSGLATVSLGLALTVVGAVLLFLAVWPLLVFPPRGGG